jgi:hypothetical protein
MRIPWSGERAPDDTQPEKRMRNVDQGGEGTTASTNLETSPDKKRRITAIIGNQNREASLKEYPYANKRSKGKKKAPTKKPTNASVSNEGPSNTKQTESTATLEQAESPKFATPRLNQTPLTPINRTSVQTSGRSTTMI